MLSNRARLIGAAAGTFMVLPMGNMLVEVVGLGVIAAVALAGRNNG